MFILQNNQAASFEQRLPDLQFKSQSVEMQVAKFDLTLTVAEAAAGLNCSLEYNTDLLDAATAKRLIKHWTNVLQAVSADASQRISEVVLLSNEERERLLREWNQTAVEYERENRVHELIQEQSVLRPEATAVVCKDERLTYAELNGRANQVARHLRKLGVGAETVVGICMERSVEMIVALFGVLKAGAAYLPLDPEYPAKRLEFMIADSQAPVVLTQATLHDAGVANESTAELDTEGNAGNLAYVIYTSGSTGEPKGVMISHRNVMNFVAGMDAVLGTDPGVWLAVTSISFDISVLELLWTLARGYEVVIATDQIKTTPVSVNPVAGREMQFSLFYFASDGGVSPEDRYKLLIDGVKFADQHGFTAVWTPERHFHEFGGSYPNPSVTNAALASITERIQLRAGSVVSPLHNPIRIAEEWSMVDNFSKGRVGISFASGWHADDFVFAPDNYKTRREIMHRDIDIVRRLWRGESHKARGGAGNEVEVKLLPRPIQPELPVWVTAAGSPDTYRLAGEIGAGLLTHLLGQTIEEVGQSVQIYRDAWRKAGHGPGDGHVTLMLHTFIGSDLDEVREKVRKPLTNYLASSLGLIRNLAKSLGKNLDAVDFTEADRESLLAHAFDRYFETSGLLGTPEKCLAVIDQLKAIGVDEVACLIDFGVEFDSAMESLNYLNEVRQLSNSKQESDYSIPALIQRHGVTHMQCTPSLATVLTTGLDGDGDSLRTLSSLNTLLLGGEALPTTLAQQLNATSSTTILNMYGPTETTIWSSTYRLSGSLRTIPIGSPIANTQLYVLDQQLSPVPVNVAGELYIGGEGVVRGYQERPELTASRFIPDPFSTRPGTRLYRTGDVARFRADGLVEYLGRADQQLKLRGYRIELGEIEAVLRSHEAVQECVVITRGEADDVRLVAYLVMQSGQALNESELRQHARERLPQYMVPAVFVELAQMPLTPNGKVNRRALPEVSGAQARSLEQAYVGARTQVEEILAGIWRELLKVERVGVHDNFFALGGHSLLATRVITRVRAAFGKQIELRSLFERPTVTEFAQLVEQVRRDGVADEQAPLVRVSREESLPLSFAQQRLWFLGQLEPESAAYNMHGAIRISGQLNEQWLEQSVRGVIERHEILRTRFESVEGQPVQVIEREWAGALAVKNLEGVAESEREQLIQQLITAEETRPFDLSVGPLLRVNVVRLSSEEHLLLLTLHHIVCDGWSIAVLMQELVTLYQSYSNGAAAALAELPVQYADYAAWQRQWLQGAVLEQQVDYWKQQLAGAPAVLSLPTDRPRPARQTFKGGRVRQTVSQELSEQLQQLSRRHGVTLFMTLLGAFQLLLARYSGQEDVVVGTPIANRTRSELEGLIGMFANTLAMRTELSGNPSFAELLGRVREVCLGAYEHQDLPFEKLVEELQPERSLSYSPIFQAAMILHNEPPADRLEIPGLVFERLKNDEEGQAKFDLLLTLTDTHQGIKVLLEYDATLFDSDTAARMLQHFETILRGVVASPSQQVLDIPLMTADEQQRLLEDSINGVVDDSFAEFNGRANLIAHELKKAGVGPEVSVGLFVEPSIESVAARLGILKAGAAIVTLPVAASTRRLSLLLERARPSVILTERRMMSNLPDHDVKVVCIDMLAGELDQPLDPAYVFDGRGQLAPIGMKGEIYLGGIGYSNHSEETAEQFVPNPCSGSQGERLWRTGLMGRRLSDGRLELTGVRGRSVSLDGHRFNLDDVEAVLANAPGVKECAVLARETAASGTELVAYVAGQFRAERLRQYMQDILSPVMAPSVYAAVAELPLTASGEVDHRALSALAVLDVEVASEWEGHLRSLPGVDQVAVVAHEAVESFPPLLLADLLPAHVENSKQVSNRHAAPPVTSETTKLAVSHGEPLRDAASLPATLAEALERAAHHPSHNGITYCYADGIEITQSYAQLFNEAQRIAGGLQRLGLKPEDKVIFQLDLNRDFIPAFWGCILGGFVPVPVSIAPIYDESNSTASKLVNAWHMLEQPIILSDERLAPAISSLGRALGLTDLRVKSIDDVRAAETAAVLHSSQPGDVAIILLTSGSTGTPKGVMQTHQNLIWRSAASAQINNFSSDDVSLNWFPLDHVGGLVMFHLRDVFTCAKQIQAPTDMILSNPLKWLDLIDEHRATVTWAPNFAYGLINDRSTELNRRHWDLSTMRFILNGGEAIAARTARRFQQLLAPHGLPSTSMHPAWGMSETCSGVTYSHRFTTDTTSDDDSFVEVGAPIPGISIRIVDGQDQPIAENMPGRLQIKGATVLPGYYRNPQVNQESFTADGWFITGDMGLLHDGRLTITGREKDVIIVNGVNYYSHEIESVIEEIDGIAISYTAACAIRDSQTNTDRLAVFFSPANGTPQLNLINQIREQVVRSIGINAEFVVPVEKDQIPKTAIGKIQRSQLAQQFKDGEFDEVLREIDLQSGKGATLPDWFFTKIWRRKQLRSFRDSISDDYVLVFLDDAGLGREVCKELERVRQPYISVEAGTEYVRLSASAFRIDISDVVHYGWLLETLSWEGIDRIGHVLHLLNYSHDDKQPDDLDAFERAQVKTLDSLLYVVQSLNQVQGDKLNVYLSVVSSNAQIVSSADKAAYEKSTSLGFLKTVPQEMPWLSCSHIDLSAAEAKTNASFVLREMRDGNADAQVAYRNSQRWVSRLQRVDLRQQPAQQLPFKQGGLYVLTGGVGGIGTEIAKHLLKNYDARLLLLGRTEVSKRAEAYRELQSLGGDVVYEAVDICDRAAVERVISEAEARWKCELDGVIHLAGFFHERLLAQTTRETMSEVLKAKVAGTWTLHQVLEPRRKDVFLMAFSSVNGFFGGATVSAYAAANSFLESFMQHLRHEGWTNSYCYSWSLWDETGMSRGYALKDLTQARGYCIIPPQQGINSLLAGLYRAEPQLLIGLDGANRNIRAYTEAASVEVEKLRAYFTSSNGALSPAQLQRGLVQDRFGRAVSCELVQLDELPLDESGEIDRDSLREFGARNGHSLQEHEAPRSETEQVLSGLWQDLLGVQRVGVNDNFFQLGGHSLLSIQLISRLRDRFQIELPLRTLFEAPTVARLAEQIETIIWLTQSHQALMSSIESQQEEGVL